jgi:hypothetical protein
VVNYVVPENKPDFMIETHLLNEPKSEKKSFTDLYKHLITGSALRLVQMNSNLTVMKKLDMFVFDEKDTLDGKKLTHLDTCFSPCGNYLIVSSN